MDQFQCRLVLPEAAPAFWDGVKGVLDVVRRQVSVLVPEGDASALADMLSGRVILGIVYKGEEPVGFSLIGIGSSLVWGHIGIMAFIVGGDSVYTNEIYAACSSAVEELGKQLGIKHVAIVTPFGTSISGWSSVTLNTKVVETKQEVTGDGEGSVVSV